jgi:hypothetical protein
MDNYNKSKFIADNIAQAVERHTNEFRKENRKAINEISEEENYDEFIKFMSSAVMQSINAMRGWENNEYAELDGLTAPQYYDSLDDPQDIIGLISMTMEKNGGIISESMEHMIKKNGEKLYPAILEQLESMVIDESKTMNNVQTAVVYIAGLLENESFLKPLSGILLQFDDNLTDEESVKSVVEVFKAVGEPSIQYLMDIVERRERKGGIYGFALVTLAGIASRNKNEDMYKYLKDCFRKSDFKFIEANALAAYGDGRAIAAIRSHVERNMESMSQWECSQYIDIISSLGGIIDDLEMKYLSLFGPHA